MSDPRGAAWDAAHEALPARALVYLLEIAFAAAVIAACSVFAPTHDGWTVGALDACPTPNFDPIKGEHQPTDWDCEATLTQWLTVAREAFDRRNPDHALVLRASLHQNASNKRFLCSPLEVAVFELADGSVRAIGVGHFCADDAQISTDDYGPD